MVWPTPQDYNEAIQNPSLCFEDPELKSGMPELTSLGLPRPVTGNFASVYRVRCPGRDWAVRCFWREFSDLEQRYVAIANHLARVRLPYTVSFEYQTNGIKVRERWFPILKMEWVEGALLDRYVATHLSDARALQDLAAAWLQMLTCLTAAGVAHGDLQHGNVLVVGDALKLVDYDGMFVPALAGKDSHELGHHNYQHPARCASHFGRELDNFAGWTIYASLLALSVRADLWTDLRAGDECLLFRKDDFVNPNESHALRAVRDLPHAEVSRLAAFLSDFLTRDPFAVPSLSVHAAVTAPDRAQYAKAGSLAARLRAPWRRLLPGVNGEPEIEPVDLLPDWVLDHVDASRPHAVSFEARGSPVGAAVLVGLMASSAVFFLSYRSVLSPSVAAVLTVILVIGVAVSVIVAYRREPSVRGIREIQSAIRHVRASQRSVNRSLRALESRSRRLSDARARQASTCHAGRERAVRREGRIIENSRLTFEEIDRVVTRAVGEVERVEAETLAALLRRLRAAHVREHLRKHRIAASGIREVPWHVTWRLRALGVRTAADISSGHLWALNRFNPSSMRPLIAWRAALQAEATRSQPRHAPKPLEDTATARSRKARAVLLAALENAADRRRSVEQAAAQVRAEREAALGRMDRECLEAYEYEMERLEEARTSLQRESSNLREELNRLHQELRPFAGVTIGAFLLHIAQPVRRAT